MERQPEHAAVRPSVTILSFAIRGYGRSVERAASSPRNPTVLVPDQFTIRFESGHLELFTGLDFHPSEGIFGCCAQRPNETVDGRILTSNP